MSNERISLESNLWNESKNWKKKNGNNVDVDDDEIYVYAHFTECQQA